MNKYNRSAGLVAISFGVLMLTFVSYGAPSAKAKTVGKKAGASAASQKAGSTSSTPSAAAPSSGAVNPSTSQGATSQPAQPSTSAPTSSAPSSPATVGSTTSSAGATTATVSAPSESKILGSIDMRPTYTTQKGGFGTENELEAGYQFNKQIKLTYVQDVNTNLYNPPGNGNTLGADGLNLMADEGYLRSKYDDIYTLADGLTLGHEARVYMPTEKGDREAGLITKVRNVIKLNQKFSDTLTLKLWELPIVHVYNRAGAVKDSAETANAAFENRVYLIADINFTKELKLSIPLMLNATRFRDYMDGAAKNNTWSYKLWTWPELDYDINSNVTVGVAFRSESLIQSDFSKFSVGDGFEKGVAQATLQLAL